MFGIYRQKRIEKAFVTFPQSARKILHPYLEKVFGEFYQLSRYDAETLKIRELSFSTQFILAAEEGARRGEHKMLYEDWDALLRNLE